MMRKECCQRDGFRISQEASHADLKAALQGDRLPPPRHGRAVRAVRKSTSPTRPRRLVLTENARSPYEPMTLLFLEHDLSNHDCAGGQLGVDLDQVATNRD